MYRRLFLALVYAVVSSAASAELLVGGKPAELRLEGESGGLLDDSAWSSASLIGRVHLLMYVDPDESKLNARVEEMLAAQKYDPTQVGSVGVVNMAATWKPGFAIDMILKSKQEKFPNTIYLRDKAKVFVKQWGLTDDSYHVVALGREGQVLFSAGGKLSDSQITTLIEAIDGEIGR